MTTKLVICDIDATLVNEKKELTPRTKKDLIQLHEKGIYFGIASGRPADELKHNPHYLNFVIKESIRGMDYKKYANSMI